MAAGESSRLNSPKQLLDWQGEYLINHIIQTVVNSEIDEITVVLGSYKDRIQSIIKNREVRIVENHDWKIGLSSSIKCGITSLDKDIAGAYVILLDQPFLSSDLLNNMLVLFRNSSAKIIAPRVEDQQSNPVLFHKDLFPDILEISGDRGAKSLLNKNIVKWLDWYDSNILLDIDSDEEYQKALELIKD